MAELNIAATKTTPAVHYRPEGPSFRVSGTSVPENTSAFYAPIMAWLHANLADLPEDCTFEFSLPYFNSSSLKAIYLLLLEVKNGVLHGKRFSVAWHIEEGDEFMIEAADTFRELTGMAIELRTGLLESGCSPSAQGQDKAA